MKKHRHALVSDRMLGIVEQALPLDGGITPKATCKKIDGSAPGYVRIALLYLVREGRAIREGDVGKCLYRRTAMEPAE